MKAVGHWFSRTVGLGPGWHRYFCQFKKDTVNKGKSRFLKLTPTGHHGLVRRSTVVCASIFLGQKTPSFYQVSFVKLIACLLPPSPPFLPSFLLAHKYITVMPHHNAPMQQQKLFILLVGRNVNVMHIVPPCAAFGVKC